MTVSRRGLSCRRRRLPMLTLASDPACLGRVAAQQRLTEAEHSRVSRRSATSRSGACHRSSTPSWCRCYFREPSTNLGVGDARGQPPHPHRAGPSATITRSPPGSADAYALTADDYRQPRTHLWAGWAASTASPRVVKAVRAERGDDQRAAARWRRYLAGLLVTSLQIEGPATWWTVMEALKPDAMTSVTGSSRSAQDRVKEIAETSKLRLPRPEHPQHRSGRSRSSSRARCSRRAASRSPSSARPCRAPAIANPRWMFPDLEFGIRERRPAQARSRRRAPRAPTLVVLLSHNGFDGRPSSWPAASRGIDVILTAHTHDAMPGVVTGRQDDHHRLWIARQVCLASRSRRAVTRR